MNVWMYVFMFAIVSFLVTGVKGEVSQTPAKMELKHLFLRSNMSVYECKSACRYNMSLYMNEFQSVFMFVIVSFLVSGVKGEVSQTPPKMEVKHLFLRSNMSV